MDSENLKVSDEKEVTRRNSEQSVNSARKSRLFTNRKNGSCPAIFSEENIPDADYLKLADKHYFTGNHEVASRYYSIILEREMNKKFAENTNNERTSNEQNDNVFINSDKHDNTDTNNNIQTDRNTQGTSEWVQQYLKSSLIESTNKITLSPRNSAGYLEKAAVLCFQNNWDEARYTLQSGMKICGDKTIFKTTLLDMERIEKGIKVQKK